MSVNTLKNYHDIQENPQENSEQNTLKIQEKLIQLQNDIENKNPEIQKIFDEISQKIAFYTENKIEVPSAVMKILDNIEAHKKPTTITKNTIEKILSS